MEIPIFPLNPAAFALAGVVTLGGLALTVLGGYAVQFIFWAWLKVSEWRS